MSTANNHEPHAHQAPQHFKGAELPCVNRSKSKLHGMASNLIILFIVRSLSHFYLLRYYNGARRRSSKPLLPCKNGRTSIETVFARNSLHKMFYLKKERQQQLYPYPNTFGTSTSIKSLEMRLSLSLSMHGVLAFDGPATCCFTLQL